MKKRNRKKKKRKEVNRKRMSVAVMILRMNLKKIQTRKIKSMILNPQKSTVEGFYKLSLSMIVEKHLVVIAKNPKLKLKKKSKNMQKSLKK